MYKLPQTLNTMLKQISKFLFCAIIVFCFTISAKGQLPIYQGDFHFDSVNDSISNKHYSSLITESYLNSNAITNGYIDQALGNGFLNNEQKQQVSDRLKENNRLGALLDVTLLYKYQLKKLTLVTSLRGKNYRHAKFSEDMFNVLMYGNKSYEDKTANLAETQMFQTLQEEIYLGVEKHFDSTNILIGGGLAFQKISYAQNKRLLKGSLYTAPQGRYIEFDGHYINEETGRKGNELTRNVGWGTTINLYAIKELNNKNRIAIELKDFGFVKVKNKEAFEVDSLYKFEGIEVNEFLNFSESTLFDPGETDFDDLLGVESNESTSTYISTASIHINYLHHISNKVYAYAGVRQLFPAPYIPLFYIKPYYKVKTYLELGPSISYGGFGNTDIGLSFKGKIANKFYYTYDFLFLEDFIIKDKSTGQGFNFSLSAIF